MSAVYAHSLPGQPLATWETLAEHSTAVGAMAADFAAPLGWAEVLRLAGNLHDIGKASPDFQAYIANERATGGDHSSAGARIALDRYGTGPGRALGTILAAIIAAHHAGLADGSDLSQRMEAAHRLVPADWQHHAGPLPEPAGLRPSVPPPQGGPKGFAWSFLLRMLFSCLVDADFIATEGFYARATGERIERGNHTDLVVLRDRLAAFMAEKRASAPSTPLNVLRAGILDHAMAKAALPPGLFSLTVPTGGGKTLASLSFALEHAVRHGLRRVILVIPYAGAWIETRRIANRLMMTMVAPHAGAWIETSGTARGSRPSPVAPHAGAWIETRAGSRPTVRRRVAPTRGRGSKHRLRAHPAADGRSPPTRGRGSKPEQWTGIAGRATSPPTRGRGSKHPPRGNELGDNRRPPRGGVDRNRTALGALRHPAVAPHGGRGSKPVA